jgi:hypothetical protein
MPEPHRAFQFRRPKRVGTVEGYRHRSARSELSGLLDSQNEKLS